jgi:hypothetical protein
VALPPPPLLTGMSREATCSWGARRTSAPSSVNFVYLIGGIASRVSPVNILVFDCLNETIGGTCACPLKLLSDSVFRSIEPRYSETPFIEGHSRKTHPLGHLSSIQVAGSRHHHEITYGCQGGARYAGLKYWKNETIGENDRYRLWLTFCMM